MNGDIEEVEKAVGEKEQDCNVSHLPCQSKAVLGKIRLRLPVSSPAHLPAKQPLLELHLLPLVFFIIRQNFPASSYVGALILSPLI